MVYYLFVKTLISYLTMQLSIEQTQALERFKAGENLFITGPGGTGKTKLIRDLVDYASSSGLSYQVCALTGCAALLLQVNARTLHSWSGIKLARGTKEEVVAAVLRNKRVVKEWRRTGILIVDEVSMMSLKVFEIIEAIGRGARKSSTPFGGMQVVFSGDFFQLPPVGTYGEPETERFCFESAIWFRVFPRKNHIELTTLFRQTDPIYQEILLQIRRGELSDANKAILHSRILPPAEVNGVIATKLFPIRAKADHLNTTMFHRLKEPEYVFAYDKKTQCRAYLESGKPIGVADLVKGDALSGQEIEYEVQQLLSGSQCLPEISLKRGSAVMCTVNIDMDAGICNGAQGVVIDIRAAGGKNTTPLPVVRFANGLVRTIGIHYWQSEEYPTIAIGQIPLCLAWALTIHKIQGATLSMAEMDLGATIFECGQTYVALSRVRSLEGLYLSAFHAQRIRVNETVLAFYDSFIESNGLLPEMEAVGAVDSSISTDPIITPMNIYTLEDMKGYKRVRL